MDERRSEPNSYKVKGGRAKANNFRTDCLLQEQGGIFEGRDEKTVLQELRKK